MFRNVIKRQYFSLAENTWIQVPEMELFGLPLQVIKIILCANELRHKIIQKEGFKTYKRRICYIKILEVLYWRWSRQPFKFYALIINLSLEKLNFSNLAYIGLTTTHALEFHGAQFAQRSYTFISGIRTQVHGTKGHLFTSENTLFYIKFSFLWPSLESATSRLGRHFFR